MTIEEQIRAATPSAAQLSEWAKDHPAPQEWWDEDFSELQKPRPITTDAEFYAVLHDPTLTPEQQASLINPYLERKRFWHQVEQAVACGIALLLVVLLGVAGAYGVAWAVWLASQFLKTL